MTRPASVLPKGMEFVGEVIGDGDLVVFGKIDGPIRITGTLVIEQAGLVRGHVSAVVVTVRGALKGDAYADEIITVDATGRQVGDLTAPRVTVVPGARVKGQVRTKRGDSNLDLYDPAKHTFAGWLASENVTVMGLTSPVQTKNSERDEEPKTAEHTLPPEFVGEANEQKPSDGGQPDPTARHIAMKSTLAADPPSFGAGDSDERPTAQFNSLFLSAELSPQKDEKSARPFRMPTLGRRAAMRREDA